MKKTRILIVLPMLGYGGTEKVAADLCRWFLSQSMLVTVYVHSDEYDYRHAFPHDVTFEINHGFFRNKSLGRGWRALRKLRRLIRKHDIVIAGAEKRATYLTYFASLGLSTPKIALIHNHYPIQLAHSSPKHRRLMRWIYPHYSHIVCVCQELVPALHQIAQLKSSQIRYIYNAIDVEQIKQRAQEPIPDEIQHRLNALNIHAATPSPSLEPLSSTTEPLDACVSKQPYMQPPAEVVSKLLSFPYFISVSRLSPEKNIHHQIAALAQLKTSIPHHLLLCGHATDSAYQARLQHNISAAGLTERVHFIGHVDNPYPLITHAAGLLLLSEREGLGIVLLEALALGCPTIAADCPVGPREVLAHGRFGHLVPVGDIQAIAAAMKAISQPIQHTIPLQMETNTNTETVDTTDLVNHLKQFSWTQWQASWMTLLQDIQH